MLLESRIGFRFVRMFLATEDPVPLVAFSYFLERNLRLVSFHAIHPTFCSRFDSSSRGWNANTVRKHHCIDLLAIFRHSIFLTYE